MSQRPYITQGSLRAQILYPHTLTAGADGSGGSGSDDDAAMQGLLSEVGLGYLLQRAGGLDAVEEWADSLSLGEQQRLGSYIHSHF